MKGIDISHWNKNIVNKQLLNEEEFVIIKATEGKVGKDPKLDTYYNLLHGCADGKPDPDKCYGFYHYARPDLGNTPEAEADWFLSLVGQHAGKCIYALDWEGASLNYPETWALKWCLRVQEKTGVKPLIYCSASDVYKMRILYMYDFGLWVAHWGVYRPVFRGYPTWAIWQYQGSPLDSNVFNGDRRAWKAYCTSQPLSEVTDG